MADPSSAAGASLDNPILNGPYDPPERHFVLGPNGPTAEGKVEVSGRHGEPDFRARVDEQKATHNEITARKIIQTAKEA